MTDEDRFYGDCIRTGNPDPAVRLKALERLCEGEVDRGLLKQVLKMARLDALPAAPGVH